MRPILFAKDATVFTTNGIGRIDCASCLVTEERNGQYELEMTVPVSSDRASDIEMESLIVAKPSANASLQAFRVYKITKPAGGLFTVLAQHISYQLSHIPAMPFSIPSGSGACASTLAALKSNAVETCPFTFSTDVTTVSSYTQVAPASIRSRLGGVDGSVLDQFGGEYEWDNFNVTLHSNRGAVTPAVTLAYGKNITDLGQEENIANTVTGVVPYWQKEEDGEYTTVTLAEKVIESQYADAYGIRHTAVLDLSQEWEDAPTEAQLRTAARAYIGQAGVGIPAVSIKVSFVNLADTEEYKDIAPLEEVGLCDNVNVYFESLGISTTAKVVKTEYDVLREKYSSIEVGSVRSGLESTITSLDASIASASNLAHFENQQTASGLKDSIDNATAWLTGSDGYVVAVKNADGTWKELLFLDTPDMESATNVLRINENGIGFSSTGVDGPYTQAWTLDGRIVIGGTNVPSLTVYSSSGNILFQVNSSGMLWNAANSELSADGSLILKSYLKDGYLPSTPGCEDLKEEISFSDCAMNLNMYGGNIENDTWPSGPYNVLYIGVYKDVIGTTLAKQMAEISNNAYLAIKAEYLQLVANNSTGYGVIGIYTGDIYIYDPSTGSGGVGYTGTINGIKFIHGICVGTGT